MMAYYKMGNLYLSEREYAAHRQESWLFWCFIFGAFTAGLLSYQYLPDAWPKFARFVAVIAGAGLGGILCGLVSDMMRKALPFIIAGSVIGALCYGLWLVV